MRGTVCIAGNVKWGLTARPVQTKLHVRCPNPELLANGTRRPARVLSSPSFLAAQTAGTMVATTLGDVEEHARPARSEVGTVLKQAASRPF